MRSIDCGNEYKQMVKARGGKALSVGSIESVTECYVSVLITLAWI